MTYRMGRAWVAALLTVLVSTAAAGCATSTDRQRDSAGGDPQKSVGVAASTGAPGAPSGSGERTGAAVPAPCALLSDAEVKSLTGMSVESRADTTPTNSDEVASCVWDLSPGGGLYLLLMRTTDEDFRALHAGLEPVAGVGDLAFVSADRLHLVVLSGTVSVDIVVRVGETDAKHLQRSVQVAKVVIPKL